DFGVPQRRRRVFLVGVRGERTFTLAEPHIFLERIGFPQRPVTASEALDDLPMEPPARVRGGTAELAEYSAEPSNAFQKYVRFGADSVTVTLHHAPTMSERDREYVRH